MKYALSLVLILITSVTLSYYLLNNHNFLPVNKFGEYNWINIVTLVFLLSIMLFTLTNLLIYLIQVILNKEGERLRKEIIIVSLKVSTLITIGTIIVFTMNYLHILNWIWGLLILLVVLIFTFII